MLENLGISEVMMAIIVFLLSVILFFMRIARKGIPRQGTSYIVSNTLFLVVCVMEIIHTISTVDDPMWFCTPSRVGWLWTIVNFILLGGIIYNQVLYLYDVINDVFTNGKVNCDINLGLLSYVGALICLILCGLFFKAGIPWVFGILGILQVIQLILIFRSYSRNVKGAFFAVFVYLLGTIGTAAISVIFIGILIFVAMAFAVLWLVLKLTGSSNSSGEKVTAHYSDGSSEEVEQTGKGILGERYYRGKESGREFQD